MFNYKIKNGEVSDRLAKRLLHGLLQQRYVSKEEYVCIDIYLYIHVYIHIIYIYMYICADGTRVESWAVLHVVCIHALQHDTKSYASREVSLWFNLYRTTCLSPKCVWKATTVDEFVESSMRLNTKNTSRASKLDIEAVKHQQLIHPIFMASASFESFVPGQLKFFFQQRRQGLKSQPLYARLMVPLQAHHLQLSYRPLSAHRATAVGQQYSVLLARSCQKW